MGINEETKTVSNVAFPVETYYREYKAGTRPHPFVECELVNVLARTAVKRGAIASDGVEVAEGAELEFHQVDDKFRQTTLEFVFQDNGGHFIHIEQVYSLLTGDPKFTNKNRMLNERIAHIFEAFVPGKAAEYLGAATLQTEDNKFTEVNELSLYYKGYFEAIANAFNTLRKGTPVYKVGEKAIPVRIKLVRAGQGKRPNVLQMPLGNCIEAIKEGGVSILSVSPKDIYELVPETTASGNLPGTPAGIPSAPPAGDLWPDV